MHDSENIHKELKGTVERVSTGLKIIERVIEQLDKRAHRVTVDDEASLTRNTNLVKDLVINIEKTLGKIQRERNSIQRFFMKNDEYQQRLIDSTNQLNHFCQIIQGTINGLPLIQISYREMPNIRKLFHNLPDKEHLSFDFSIVQGTPDTVLALATEDFDPVKCDCYMQARNERLCLSYRLRTWSTPTPMAIILSEGLKRFRKHWHIKSASNLTGSNSSLDSLTTAHSAPFADAAAAIPHRELDFSQFFMSSDDICGIVLTQATIYIATKHEITIVSLCRQEIIVQYRKEGTGRNTFQHISCIYIHTPTTDETNLYVVDRGQYVAHQYRIDNLGQRFEYVRQYVIIADINQQYNLKSCVIFNNNLYVSDSGNNCLHIFSLRGERQSFCLVDKAMTPFSPGSLCAHGDYLYVADSSKENPSILILNAECESVDRFRNESLKQILAIDIDPNINGLFVLTTTNITTGDKNKWKKRPMIVSMDLLLRSEHFSK